MIWLIEVFDRGSERKLPEYIFEEVQQRVNKLNLVILRHCYSCSKQRIKYLSKSS